MRSDCMTYTLVNRIGEALSLTSDNTFFYDSSGYGVELSNTYRQAGRRFVLTSSKPKQAEISGKVYLKGGSSQERFLTFERFCQQAPLTLQYTPETTTFSRRVRVSKITKDATYHAHAQSISVELVCETPWYQRVAVTTVADTSKESWTWGITWGVTWGSSQTNTVVINSDTYLDSPCRLVINGATTSPTWSHYVDGVLVESGGFSASTAIAAGNSLVVDNTVDPYQMRIVKQGTETLVRDVYQSRDFAKACFMTVRHGHNVIAVSDTAGTSLTISAEAYLYYDSV